MGPELVSKFFLGSLRVPSTGTQREISVITEYTVTEQQESYSIYPLATVTPLSHTNLLSKIGKCQGINVQNLILEQF